MDLARSGIKGVLWRTFKHYGPLAILYPRPTLAIDEDGRRASASVIFLIVKKEHSLPSALIDRGSLDAWQSAGCKPVETRARERVDELLGQYERKPLLPEVEEELWKVVERAARDAGLDSVPRYA